MSWSIARSSERRTCVRSGESGRRHGRNRSHEIGDARCSWHSFGNNDLMTARPPLHVSSQHHYFTPQPPPELSCNGHGRPFFVIDTRPGIQMNSKKQIIIYERDQSTLHTHLKHTAHTRAGLGGYVARQSAHPHVLITPSYTPGTRSGGTWTYVACSSRRWASSWKRISKRSRRTSVGPLAGSASREYESASGGAESCAAARGGEPQWMMSGWMGYGPTRRAGTPLLAALCPQGRAYPRWERPSTLGGGGGGGLASNDSSRSSSRSNVKAKIERTRSGE
jgi:hypothetical protein